MNRLVNAEPWRLVLHSTKAANGKRMVMESGPTVIFCTPQVLAWLLGRWGCI